MQVRTCKKTLVLIVRNRIGLTRVCLVLQHEIDMVPLMMQVDYKPTGWLGLILGCAQTAAQHRHRTLCLVVELVSSFLAALFNFDFNCVLAAEPSCTIDFLPRPSIRSRNLRSRWMPWRERSAIAARPRLCRLHAVSRRACLHSLWLWSRHQLRHQLRLRLQHLHGHRHQQQQQQPRNKPSRRACTLCPVQLLSHSSRPCPPHPMTPPPAAAALLSPWSW